MKVVCGCAVVRFRNGSLELLLVSEDGEEWGFPKGHLEPGEKMEDAAVRETFEETSLLVQPFGFAGKQEQLYVWYAFPADEEEEPIPQEEEILAAGYYPIDNLPALEIRQLPLIEKVVANLAMALKM